MNDMDLWRLFMGDPERGAERTARARAARRGNREAFESIGADYRAWRQVFRDLEASVSK